ncbi:SNF2-related protein [Coralloluteibacterium thermophilus]|uniref:SNF2-related protein n=1 Tax=Coralloluteibacterium thermophilum TaxID=2707049 RepID=A0ABV9NPF9_9GAMM
MNPEALHEQLAAGHWRDRFPPARLREALAALRAGDVLQLRHEAQAPGAALTGLVADAGALRPVTVHLDAQGVPAADEAEPAGAHAAALLTTAAALPPAAWPNVLAVKPDRIPEPAEAVVFEAAAWRDWLAAVQASLGDVWPDARQRFGLLIRAQPPEDEAAEPASAVEAATHRRRSIPRLCVGMVWVRPGERPGSLVDPQPLSIGPAGPAPAPPGGWPEEVAEAIVALLAGTLVSHGGVAFRAVATAAQEAALRTLLARYPAWYEAPSEFELLPGPPRALQLAWQPLSDGSQVLTAGIQGDDGNAQLLRGAEIWYVHALPWTLGAVEADPRLLEALSASPVLQPEQINDFLQQQKRGGAAALLPVPALRGPVRRIDADPVPVLSMRRIVLPRGRRDDPDAPPPEAGVASVAIDYGPLRVPLGADGATLRRLIDGQVVEIRRDLNRERRLLTALQKAGLVIARNDPTGVGLRAQLRPADLFARPDPKRPPLAPEAWRPLLRQLTAAGARVEYEEDFPHNELIETGDWHLEIGEHGSAWFDVHLGIDIQGKRIDMLPLLRRVLESPDFPMQPVPGEKANATWRVPVDDHRSIALPLARLRALIAPLLEWLQTDKAGHLRVHRTQAATLAELSDAARLRWSDATGLRKRLIRMREGARTEVDAPEGFQATLRPYQRQGLAWLDYLGETGLGGVLADDMGLGKTVQVLAHLLAEKRKGHLDVPALVVCPTSLVGNWRDEAARFAPELRTLVLHGSGRADAYDAVGENDLVITTYPLLPRDRERLIERTFAVLVMDEAQAIKNAKSLAAQVVREIPARRRLAMTGTPLENHLGELWAQFDAVEPGLLGSERQFTRLYRTPIEKHGDRERQQRLNRRIGPLLLRRRKDDVLHDLPEKTEIVRHIDLEGDQRALYETLRLAQHARVLEAVSTRGLSQSGIVVIDALLKLRQVCCDPRLVKLETARNVRSSAKLEALMELLDSLLSEGRRVLLFSQFTEMLELIAQALHARDIAHLRLTGQTPGSERAAMVRRFQDGELPLFLISLKAGGVGLNLTAADTVIHYDPWWNPAAEAQATDRAHRIGQEKPVFVYRLICTGTVEQKIQALQTRKSDLARAVLEEGGSTSSLRFDESDLAELFEPL